MLGWPKPDPVGPGQESVWDYPRPPRAEPSNELIEIEVGGVLICSTTRSVRVLETSHPPTYYLPISAFMPGSLEPSTGSSYCEYKGIASYLTLVGGSERRERAAWFYPDPVPGFTLLRDHLALYPAAVDRCTVDQELVRPQAGGFYGGWITSRVVGPFKGGPGTNGW